MKVRESLIAAVVAALFLIGIVWLALVSPERGKASSLSAQITTEQSALASADATLAADRATTKGYAGDVRAIDRVLIAVPTTVGQDSVIRTVTHLAGTTIDVHQISAGSAAASGTGPIGETYTLTLHASYVQTQNYLAALDRLTGTDGTNLEAAGRLFTISSVVLSPGADDPNQEELALTVTAYSQAPLALPAPISSTGATGATSATDTSTVTP